MKLAEIKKLVETYDLTALAAAEQHLMEGEPLGIEVGGAGCVMGSQGRESSSVNRTRHELRNEALNHPRQREFKKIPPALVKNPKPTKGRIS